MPDGCVELVDKAPTEDGEIGIENFDHVEGYSFHSSVVKVFK